eukprot:GHVU01047928.1.p1 GENE.GHVU01047928.1~~GHVU01047928.1.p1  ORF type:complete len:161 (+),score=21.39 GHVU01047928.1:318-800(+)
MNDASGEERERSLNDVFTALEQLNNRVDVAVNAINEVHAEIRDGLYATRVQLLPPGEGRVTNTNSSSFRHMRPRARREASTQDGVRWSENEATAAGSTGAAAEQEQPPDGATGSTMVDTMGECQRRAFFRHEMPDAAGAEAAVADTVAFWAKGPTSSVRE